MTMKCCLMFLLAVATAGVTFAGNSQMTQSELDVYVDREMFKFIHGEDYRSEVEWLKSKGVTDEMLGRAYVKIARRVVGQPRGIDDKCYLAIDGIAEFCTGDMQLTNLLFMAEHTAVDDVRAHAIWVLSTKAPSDKFTGFAERVAASTNLGVRAGSKLMSCLSEICRRGEGPNPVLKKRILQILRRHLEARGRGSLIADRVLAEFDKQYRNSDFRKRVARMMLDPVNSPLNGNRNIDRYRVEKEYVDILRGSGK